jgi:hypothetical protein
MPDYTALASTAARLIREAGFKLTLARPVAGTYNPVVGAGTGSTTLTGVFDAATLPASKGTVEAFDDRLKQEVIKGNVRFFILAAATAPFVPEPGDQIPSYQGKAWSILGCTPLEPNGTTALIYKIGCQRV